MGVFSTVLQNGISRGHLPGKTQTAREWFRTSARNFGARIRGEDSNRVDYKRSLDKRIIKDFQTSENSKSLIKPGSMYMYSYDAKHKDTLPYWDQFPLIFPFRVQHDRFWGINLHYLSYPLRAKLMDALYDITNNARYDDSTKLVLSYKVLNGSAKFNYFKPCVKQYLISHVKTRFFYIHPEEWDIALFLPTEKFVGKAKTSVWAESKRQLGIRKHG